MKSVYALILSTCCCFGVFAQKCEDYPLMQPGKLVSMTSYNRAGAPIGKAVYHVQELNPRTGASRIHLAVFDARGNVLSDGMTFVQCNGSIYRASIYLVMSQLSVKQLRTFVADPEQYVEYPLTMKPGDVLRDARFALRAINSEGLVTDMEVALEDRRVIGEEALETITGIRNCLKIKTHISFRAQVSGISIPLSVDNIEWFSPELGVVKNEAKSFRSEITSIE